MSFGTSPARRRTGDQEEEAISRAVNRAGRNARGRTELLHADPPRVNPDGHKPEPMAQHLILDDRRVVVHEDVLDRNGGDLADENAPEGVGDRGVEADKVERDSRGRERVDGDLSRLAGREKEVGASGREGTGRGRRGEGGVVQVSVPELDRGCNSGPPALQRATLCWTLPVQSASLMGPCEPSAFLTRTTLAQIRESTTGGRFQRSTD